MGWKQARISYPSAQAYRLHRSTARKPPPVSSHVSRKLLPAPHVPLRCLHVRPLPEMLMQTLVPAHSSEGYDINLPEYWEDEIAKQLVLRFTSAVVLRLPTGQLVDGNTMMSEPLLRQLVTMMHAESPAWLRDVLLDPLFRASRRELHALPQLRHLQTLCWHLPFDCLWNPYAADLDTHPITLAQPLAASIEQWLAHPTPILTLSPGRRMCRQTVLQKLSGRWWAYPYLDLDHDGHTLVWKMPRIREDTPHFFSLWTYT
jgi:hypothetical protein